MKVLRIRREGVVSFDWGEWRYFVVPLETAIEIVPWESLPRALRTVSALHFWDSEPQPQGGTRNAEKE